MSPEQRPTHLPLVPPGGIDHHVGDMTFTASADLTLEQLQEKLGAAGQWLPIDGDPGASLGKLIDTNSTGPLRLGFGAWRDFLLGAQFTTGSGTLITGGGRAIKNVAGYDITKFMVGQHGLFGRLVTLTSRAYKRPTSALRVKFGMSDTLLSHLLPTAGRPQWAMITEGFLFCGYLGDEEAMAFHQQNLRELQHVEMVRQTVEEDIAFRARHWSVRDFRASVPPTRLGEFLRQAQVQSAAADPAFGIIVGPAAPADRARLRQIAASLGGGVVFDDPDEIKSALNVSGPAGMILKRLKSAFDA